VKIGTKVKHPTHGVGKVISVVDAQTVLVEYDNQTPWGNPIEQSKCVLDEIGEERLIFKCPRCGKEFIRKSHYNAIIALQNEIRSLVNPSPIKDMCMGCGYVVEDSDDNSPKNDSAMICNDNRKYEGFSNKICINKDLNEHKDTIVEIVDSFKKMCDFIEQSLDLGCSKCPVFNECLNEEKHQYLWALMEAMNMKED
jgi:hypothetical protein